MTNKDSQTGIGMTVAITAMTGVLAGTLLGLALGRRGIQEADAVLTESVEDLTRRAHRVLGELSSNAEAWTAQRPLPETRR